MCLFKLKIHFRKMKTDICELKILFRQFLFQRLGTTVAQLVFVCCRHCPKKSLIEEIIKLEKTMVHMAILTNSILEFADKERYNCLMSLFDMMTCNKIKTGKYPDSSMLMLDEIEATAFYLIKMAEDNNLDMDHILNWTAANGKTILFLATFYSESIARELLKKDVVVVTTVDSFFQIPTFRVSKIYC